MAEIETTRDGAVLTIRLGAALDRAACARLGEGLGRAADPTIRAVLLLGADGVFATDAATAPRAAADFARETLHPLLLALRALEKPVLAAVGGIASGTGLALVLASDVRLASESASLIPAASPGSSWLVPRLVGAGRAFEWLSTGRPLAAREALAWGLLSEVVGDAELEHRAREVGELFARMPTRALAEEKRLLDAAAGQPLAAQLELEARAIARLAGTPDATEAVAAAAEGRPPAYTGAPAPRLHPVELVNHDDLRRWRLTVALRWLLVIPHLLVLEGWFIVALPVLVVAWLATLIRGTTPRGLHGWLARLLRYQLHVYAYLFLVADPYPPFRGWEGTYPIDLEIAPPARQARWKTLLRPLLVLPAYVFATVLNYVVQLVALLGLVYALALGRYPRGFRDLSAYCLRYAAQTWAYLLLLTDRYPTLQSDTGFDFEEG